MPDESVKTAEDVRELVTRMVTNGLSASDGELKLIIGYIVQTMRGRVKEVTKFLDAPAG
jgi:hypothetical protein